MKVGFQMLLSWLNKFLGFLDRSQINIEIMYNLASVLIALRHYHLQLENLDQIITMVKMGQMIHTWIAWQMQTSRIYIKSEIV